MCDLYLRSEIKTYRKLIIREAGRDNNEIIKVELERTFGLRFMSSFSEDSKYPNVISIPRTPKSEVETHISCFLSCRFRHGIFLSSISLLNA